jgi:hypothetical protein
MDPPTTSLSLLSDNKRIVWVLIGSLTVLSFFTRGNLSRGSNVDSEPT